MVRYLKDKDTLYASRGEDFNQASLFSEYKIIKKIGQGGFGAVMLGVHKVTKEEVALKFVNAHAYGNGGDVNSIFNEAELLKKLNHDNIVKIINTIPLGNL